jgi:hypothetical protein
MLVLKFLGRVAYMLLYLLYDTRSACEERTGYAGNDSMFIFCYGALQVSVVKPK